MQVANAWLIYILVVLGVYILLSWCGHQFNMDTLTKLFIATLVGAVVTLIIIPGVVSGSSDERVWYTLLLVVAFIGPLLLAAWLAWSRGWLWTKGGESAGTTSEYICDNDEECRLVSTTVNEAGAKSVFHFR